MLCPPCFPFLCYPQILSRRFLKRTIQEGSHDSAVDARTALDLALLKIKHGGLSIVKGFTVAGRKARQPPKGLDPRA